MHPFAEVHYCPGLVGKRSKGKRKAPAVAPTRPPQPRAAAAPAAPTAPPVAVPEVQRGPVHAAGLLRPLALVAGFAVLVYLNGIPGDFVFDDKLIQRDPRINGQEPFWRIFVTDYWYTYIGTSADLYRPLTIASYALNFMVAGLSSPAFHAVNILLHAAVCLLVVLLIDALLRERTLAVVAGLLFATHPVHTEAVTGIVGRAEILTALFLLAALYLHARHYTLRGKGPALWVPLAGVAYLCALLSKETAIVGPGLLLVVDVVDRARRGGTGAGAWLRRIDLRTPSVQRTLAILGLYVAVAVVYLLIRFLVVGQLLQRPPAKSYYLLFGHPLATRLFTGCKVLAIYLRLLLFPSTLSADYSYRQVVLAQSLDNTASVIGLAAGLCLIAVFVWALRRQVLAAIFALAFFAVAYSVVGNLIVPIGVLVAERLMYLPSVGFCASLAWLGVSLARRLNRADGPVWLRRVPAGVLLVVLALYSGRTIVRNLDWRDHITLYRATVEASPQCHAALFNYAAALMQYSKAPESQEIALQHLLRANAIRNDHFPSLVNLTIIYMRRREWQTAHEWAVKARQVKPGNKKIRGMLQTIEKHLQQQGKAAAS